MGRRQGRGRPQATTRESIEEAACELFLEQGYAATSVDDIARRAGVSRSSFFNYFAGKADVLWGPVLRELEAVPSAFAAAEELLGGEREAAEREAAERVAAAGDTVANAAARRDAAEGDGAWNADTASAAVANAAEPEAAADGAAEDGGAADGGVATVEAGHNTAAGDGAAQAAAFARAVAVTRHAVLQLARRFPASSIPPALAQAELMGTGQACAEAGTGLLLRQQTGLRSELARLDPDGDRDRHAAFAAALIAAAVAAADGWIRAGTARGLLLDPVRRAIDPVCRGFADAAAVSE